MIHTRDIHGHKVLGEDDVVAGMDYLDYNLQFPEAEVFFKTAKNSGAAQFEDAHDRQFTLKHNHDGTYQLTSREKGGKGFFSGWF